VAEVISAFHQEIDHLFSTFQSLNNFKKNLTKNCHKTSDMWLSRNPCQLSWKPSQSAVYGNFEYAPNRYIEFGEKVGDPSRKVGILRRSEVRAKAQNRVFE
jgi:hypothetical protein